MPEGLEIGRKYRNAVQDIEGICTDIIEDVNGCQHAVLVLVIDEPLRGQQPYQQEVMDVWLTDAETGEPVTRGPSIAEGKLGIEYRDRLTGLQGVAVRRRIYKGDGAQLVLQPPYDKEKGEMPKRYGIDEQTLVRVEDEKPVPTTAVGGGPMVEDQMRPE